MSTKKTTKKRDWMIIMGSSKVYDSQSIRRDTVPAFIYSILIVGFAAVLLLNNIPQSFTITNIHVVLSLWYAISFFVLAMNLVDTFSKKTTPKYKKYHLLYFFQNLCYAIGGTMTFVGKDKDNEKMLKSGIVIFLFALFWSGLGAMVRAWQRNDEFKAEKNFSGGRVTFKDEMYSYWHTREWSRDRIYNRRLWASFIVVALIGAQATLYGVELWQRGLDINFYYKVSFAFALFSVLILFMIVDMAPLDDLSVFNHSQRLHHLYDALYFGMLLAGTVVWSIGYKKNDDTLITTGVAILAAGLIVYAMSHFIEVTLQNKFKTAAKIYASKEAISLTSPDPPTQVKDPEITTNPSEFEDF